MSDFSNSIVFLIFLIFPFSQIVYKLFANNIFETTFPKKVPTSPIGPPLHLKGNFYFINFITNLSIFISSFNINFIHFINV